MDKRSNADNHNLCHFSFSDGRRCRMLRHRDHLGLCPFHSREERQRVESERIGTELAATLTGNYLTATDINHVLGKVFTALAQDRISAKKAKVLCYAAQLMLASLRTVRLEYQFKYSFEAWQRMQKNAVPLPDPLAPINDPIADDDLADDAVADAGDDAGDDETLDDAAPASEDLNVAPDGPEARGNNNRRSSAHGPTELDANANEDQTEEPALTGAGSTTRRGS
jgi:hypothetical protein